MLLTPNYLPVSIQQNSKARSAALWYHSQLHSDISLQALYAVLQGLEVFLQSVWILQVYKCQTENFHLSSCIQSICIHMPRFSWSGLTWWLCKIVPHTCQMIFHILPSVALFSLSFSLWKFLSKDYKILFWSLHSFYALLLFLIAFLPRMALYQNKITSWGRVPLHKQFLNKCGFKYK